MVSYYPGERGNRVWIPELRSSFLLSTLPMDLDLRPQVWILTPHFLHFGGGKWGIPYWISMFTVVTKSHLCVMKDPSHLLRHRPRSFTLILFGESNLFMWNVLPVMCQTTESGVGETVATWCQNGLWGMSWLVFVNVTQARVNLTGERNCNGENTSIRLLLASLWGHYVD